MISEALRQVLLKHQGRGALLDTNLLLLLFVGVADQKLIVSFKRTRSLGFSIGDFELLQRVVRFLGDKVTTTPHILAETSNYIFQLGRPSLLCVLEKAAMMIEGFSELYAEACELTKRGEFMTHGLTDTGILEAGKNGSLIISVDYDLVAYASKSNLGAVNFNHIRKLA
ncbi:MAG: hypothetical protein ABSE90_08315 [Verrucomicrobiota bacterium]|jgi:hypothetical protein